MAANWRACILTWVLGGVLILALAGCVPADDTGATATLIDFPTATESAVPASPTGAPTNTSVPATATDRPRATVAPSGTPVPATKTVVPATKTVVPATNTAVPATATQAAGATASPPTEAAGVTASPPPDAGDFSPTAVSIWDIPNPGTDDQTGECASGFTHSYGLVQITPQGDTLGWKNQEPAPYTFSRVSANVWQYSGPSAVGDGTVTMTVTFTSATTFDMTHVFVASDAPNCTHTHQMAGTFRNFQ